MVDFTQQPVGPLGSALMPTPKLNILGIIADALAGAAGRPGPYGQLLGLRQQMQLENAQYEQRQQAEFERQREMYDYQRYNPNDELTQYMHAAGIDPNSPQGRALFGQAVQNKVNPFAALDVQQPNGSTVREFVRPPTVPTAPVGALSDTPPASPAPAATGGPTPRASGTFPKPHRKK